MSMKTIGATLVALSLLAGTGVLQAQGTSADVEAGVGAAAAVGGSGASATATAAVTVATSSTDEEDASVEPRPRQQNRAGFAADLKAKREAAAKALGERQASIEARIEVLKNAQAEVKVRLQASAKKVVEAGMRGIMQRFRSVVRNLESVSARLETRIAKLQDEGIDMSASAKLLAEADAKLAVAKEDVTAVEASVDQELTTGVTSKESLRAHVKAAKESLKAAHAAYVDVITSIRGSIKAKVGAEAEATTTSN